MMRTECLAKFLAGFTAPENAQQQQVIGWSDEDLSDAAMLARLPLIAATATQVDRHLRLRVGRIRERHMISYAEIGKALGVSRQAVWERISTTTRSAPRDAQDNFTA